jgi:Fe2+ transport system protein FeoA
MSGETHGSNSQGPVMMLSMVVTGETVVLLKIAAGRRLRRRLADLGLTVGMEVRMVQNHFAGPVILAVKHDSRLAIGRGMAAKIQVCPHTTRAKD